jgi:hypothetical protein
VNDLIGLSVIENRLSDAKGEATFSYCVRQNVKLTKKRSTHLSERILRQNGDEGNDDSDQ